jgi:hypothetical protein
MICKEFNIKIYSVKTKVMAFKRSQHLRAKIMTDNKETEQIKESNNLGYSVSYLSNNAIYNKLQKFQYLCGENMAYF